jgi:phosphatidylserine/phosphatidylglycerophosphate/cardiolipin synthase-like enzyme
MVENINSSKKRVYVEVYIFTEKRLRKALIDAHKRGVEVKVLLEKNVYKASSLNNDTYKSLKNA